MIEHASDDGRVGLRVENGVVVDVFVSAELCEDVDELRSTIAEAVNRLLKATMSFGLPFDMGEALAFLAEQSERAAGMMRFTQQQVEEMTVQLDELPRPASALQ